MRFSRIRPAFAAIVLAALPAQAACLYYTDQPAGSPGSVIAVTPDGSRQQTLLTVAGAPDLRGIAWHRASGRLFVLDNGTAKRIFSILPDGTGEQTILALNPEALSADLEIDDTTGHCYWAEASVSTAGNGFVKRAALDGSGVQPVVTTLPGVTTAPYFLFLDPVGGFIYWGVPSSGSGPSNFRRATFDGVVDPDFLLPTPTRTRDLAVDAATQTVYWCDRQSGAIYHRPLEGGITDFVLSGLNAPHGLALDPEAGKVYWADTGARGSGPFNTSARRIARCNLDGTEFENLSTPEPDSEPWDLAFDTASPTYADWRTRFFSITTPLAGPNDDSDFDGAPNLLEYALGTHPRRATDIPRLAADGTALHHTRRRHADLTYQVEVSTDLVHWHFNGDDTALIWTTDDPATPLTPDLETARVLPGPALANAPAVFFRLRIAAPSRSAD
ncbi:MAG TPA: hypothetical protein PKM73_08340 [Verrucomicrobiota bacterium]|nr:hypothetical protein [Verrucomicrobiota bacterium]HNU49556.1 hypothetical protein [Verrucomicrobiota bacterium]